MAQDHQLEKGKREKLQALKVAYLTEQLELSAKEAQDFWPIYNELEDEIKKVRRQRRKNRQHTKANHAEMTEAELAKAIDVELDLEQQELDLKKLYNERFKRVLSIRKVAKLHALEDGFKRRLLKGARENRKGTAH